ncbi:MAG: hypothetical protein INQ03_20000 [Candidatus Heimdallarchaeota archaeon]|nr:hypothetical protein [Candidatus Heimdallarchaeota archaeon]
MNIGIYQLLEINDRWVDLITSFAFEIFQEEGRNSWLTYVPFGLIAVSNEETKFPIPRELFQYLYPLEPIEGNLYIIGFKVGSFRSTGHYHSSKGGVLPPYRRLGIAKKLQDYTDTLLADMDVRNYTFNTYPNVYLGMFVFGLMNGYTLVNHLPSDDGFKVTFQKNFDGSTPRIIAKERLPEMNYFEVALTDKDTIITTIKKHEMIGWKIKDDGHYLLFNDQPRVKL